MGLFETRPVTLDDFRGHGYAFKRKTAFGQAIRGVVFIDSTDGVDQLREQESITFSGPCYNGERASQGEIDVRVEDITTTPMGTRVDFVEIDYPETLLQ